jgi:hypothetical protein
MLSISGRGDACVAPTAGRQQMDSRVRGNDKSERSTRLDSPIFAGEVTIMLGDLVERWRVQAMRALQGWATEKRTLRGVPVTLVNTRPDIDSELVFRRLDTALALIQQYRPATFAQLLQDFSRIQVVRYPCRAAFYPDSRTCVVELTFSVNPEFTEAQIASSIVHEGMHAHVFAMGQSNPAERPDEERLCRQAELEFGLAIPNGEAIVQRATESLQLGDEDVAPVIDWQQARQAIAEVDARATSHGGESGGERGREGGSQSSRS